jgi:xylulokinase
MQGVGLGAVNQVRVSGGGAKSTVWRQILADVLGVELVTVDTTEGAAYGAALLAGVALGAWADIASACAQTINVTERVTPNAKNVQRYSQMYKQYEMLYPALKPTFNGLAAIGG